MVELPSRSLKATKTETYPCLAGDCSITGWVANVLIHDFEYFFESGNKQRCSLSLATTYETDVLSQVHQRYAVGRSWRRRDHIIVPNAVHTRALNSPNSFDTFSFLLVAVRRQL